MAEENEHPLSERERSFWIVAIAGFTGLWGIATGFAVFILVRTGDFSNPANFVIGLAVAALASWIVETLRESIHGKITVRPTRRIGSVAVTIVTLLVFELFILAAHNAVDLLGNPHELIELREALLGPALDAARTAKADLLALAGIWMITGAVVGVALGWYVLRERDNRPMRERTLRGALTGIVAAVAAAPALVLVYIVCVRVALAVALAISNPAGLADHYAGIVTGFANVRPAGEAATLLMLGPVVVFGLLKFWFYSVAGKVTVVALLAIVIAVGVRWKEWRPLYVLMGGCAIGIVAPLLFDAFEVFRLALLAAVVWFVPGLVLGAAAPLLEEPSDRAHLWSTLATVLGAIVAVLTALRWHELASRNLLLVALAIAFFAAAMLFTRYRDLREFWPAMALCLSSIAASLTFLLVSLTASFHGVLTEVSTLDALPATVAASPQIAALEARAHDFALDWSTRGVSSPLRDEANPVMTAYLNLASKDQEDRDTLIRSNHDVIVSLNAQARTQFAAVLRGDRPPVTVPARTLDNDDALQSYAEAAIRRADAQWDAAHTRFHEAPNAAAAKAASDDAQWWERYSLDIRLAAARVIDGDALLASSDTVLKYDEDAANTIAAERAFSRSAAPEQLEVSLAGSFSFWVTVGLLSAWAIRRAKAEDEHGQEAGEERA